MRYHLEYPAGARVIVKPDPAKPGAILRTTVGETRPQSFVISPDECGKLATALADYVPGEEPGIRVCPVCGHDERDTDFMAKALRAARKRIEADLFCLLESHCQPDETGSPRRETLDESAVAPVAEAERLIAQIDTALS